MIEAGRSQSRGKHRSIDPSFDNSPYLSSPIRPIPSTSGGGKKLQHCAQCSNGNSQNQSKEDIDDGIAPLRDITVSSKSPTSLLRSTSRSRCVGRQRDADDDGCSLADSTICTTRTTKGNAVSRKSPYLMGAGGTNTNSGGSRSASAKRVGRGAKAATAKTKPPKLLLMPDEIDEMLLEFEQRQHEEGKLLLRNTGEDAADGGGDDAGVDADEEYSSDEEDDESSKVSSSSSSSEE